MRRISIFIWLTRIMFGLNGCIPLLVGSAVYGVQKGKKNKTERLAAYDDYIIGMEKINLEREIAGLEPRAITSFADWNEQIHQSKTELEYNKELKEMKEE